MTKKRLEELRQFATRHGAANCWTGTSGTAAAHIVELIKAIEELRAEKSKG